MSAPPGAGVVVVARRWLTPSRIEIAAIVLFTLFLMWPFLQRDRMVLSFDGLAYSGPNLHVTLEALKSGELPLWNRFIFGGVSHAGNPQTGFWYPLLLLGLPFSTTRALNVISAAHIVLFVGGMVALCRWRLRLRPPATFVGTAIAIGCGAMASKTIQFEQLLVVAWIPMLLALLHWMVTADRPLRATGCTALATGAWLTAGHPHTVYLVAPVLVVWTVALVVDHEAPRRLVHAAGAAAMGAVMALPHLQLALRATDISALGGGRDLDDVRAVGWLQGRTIVPGLLGNPTSLNPGDVTHDFESTTYIGVAAAVLVIAGIVTGAARGSRRCTTLGLGGLAVLCLVLATGPVTPIFRFAFDVVPGFDLGRVSARWVLPASLCLAVLAAWGADAAHDATARQRRAALLAIAGAGAFAAIAALAYTDEVPGRRVAAVWVLVAAVTTAAWVLRPRTAGAVAAGLLLLPAVFVGGELGVAARHSFARTVLYANAPETATSDALDFFDAHPEGRTLAMTIDDLGNNAYLPTALRPNVNGTLGVASIDGYDGGVQITKRWAAVFAAQIPTWDPELAVRAQLTEPLDPSLWARFGVRYALVDPRTTGASLLTGWNGPLLTGEFEIYENPAWRGEAEAWFATRPVEDVTDAADALLADPAANTATVETDDEALACTLAECAATGLPVERRSPSNLVVQADLAAPAIVTIGEQFDEGWHVSVDGESADVLAVDGVRIGVAVPAGAHEVHFTYRPEGLTLSIVASLLAALAAAVLAAGIVRCRT